MQQEPPKEIAAKIDPDQIFVGSAVGVQTIGGAPMKRGPSSCAPSNSVSMSSMQSKRGRLKTVTSHHDKKRATGVLGSWPISWLANQAQPLRNGQRRLIPKLRTGVATELQ